MTAPLILLVAFALYSGFAEASAPFSRNLENSVPPTSHHEFFDAIDQILGSDRFEDNFDKFTVRALVSDQTSRFHWRSAPKLGVRVNVKLKDLQALLRSLQPKWMERAESWEEKATAQIVNEIESTGHDSDATNASAERHSRKEEPWRLSFEKNVAISKGHPELSVLGRLRRDFKHSRFLLSVGPELGWSAEHIWQSGLTSLAAIRLGEAWSLRLENDVRWMMHEKVLYLYSALGLIRMMNNKRVVSFGGAVQSQMQHQDLYAKTYNVHGLYRQDIYRRSWFLSIQPRLDFARDERFRGDPGIYGMFDVLF